jgi:hypothetical protein
VEAIQKIFPEIFDVEVEAKEHLYEVFRTCNGNWLAGRAPLLLHLEKARFKLVKGWVHFQHLNSLRNVFP